MAGEDENKRIVLRIPRTNPELHAEIHKYPVDYRAKRLLYLASIGLMELVKQGMIEAPFANQAPVAVGSAPTPYHNLGAGSLAAAPKAVAEEIAPVVPVQAAPANEAQGEPVKQPSPAVTEKPSGAPKRRQMPPGAFKSDA